MEWEHADIEWAIVKAKETKLKDEQANSQLKREAPSNRLPENLPKKKIGQASKTRQQACSYYLQSQDNAVGLPVKTTAVHMMLLSLFYLMCGSKTLQITQPYGSRWEVMN